MTSRRRRTHPVVLGLAGLLAVLAVPGLVLAVNAARFAAYRYAAPGPAAQAAVASVPPRPHDPAKPTAVVLVSDHGANVADTLVPYDILAGTGAFNVYTVAPDRRPVPLLGGLDLVPDLGFAELEARLGGAAPAVTVVPEMPDIDPATDADDAPVTVWLRDRASRGLVLGVCTGARLVAEAGLIDGRPATSHWYRLAGLADDHPQVAWQRGIRYVDDGDVVTTGGLLSSVDGTLRVVERLLGSPAAAEAARRAGWSHYAPGSPSALPPSGLNLERAGTHVLDLGFRSGSTTFGVVLTDGVGELDLAAAFAPYAEVKAARTLALGDHAIRSRHGLTFVPRAGLPAVADVDRLLVPASAGGPLISAAGTAAAWEGTPVERLGGAPGGFAFDEALRVMSRSMDRATARWAAVILEYPPEDLRLEGPAWPWGPTLAVLGLGLSGAAAAVGVSLLACRRPRAHSDEPPPDGDPAARSGAANESSVAG
ncbi:hypothetical protein Acsp06_43530 [Actinomycetospora sp. NBRC 106375]|uniref:DJ-1/PfpI family protein n=1 Tax=Actinomycetospora sp. NBRC 106375 TaxID=3032207 RepID=UPI0024A5548E|nr:DJ-1/PfpI family protein [Actinomycetospora sp. NBRC 106375]GLZ48168.1 hypothetical protein Acsp06_43530 [Actinomycetospora sp. NBRC 106375]